MADRSQDRPDELIRFSSQRRVSSYLPSAAAGGDRPVRLSCELRRDPLTRRTGRVAHFLGFKLEAPELADTVTRSRAGCPFCPERVLEVTPRLPPQVIPEGLIQRGEAVLFPNISPYDRQSVVVVLTRDHFLEADQFRASQIEDGLLASIEYFQRLPGPARGVHSLLTWNYMPPAGATQVHAHFQGFATDRPGPYLAEELRRSRGFWRRHRVAYWEELAGVEERLGERFVARRNHTVWLTAFVSSSAISDLLVLFPGQQRLESLPGEAVREFAEGLVEALSELHREGVRSFNLAFYSAPSGGDQEHFWLHARISPRIYLSGAIRGSDTTVWQHLLGESLMVRSPEELASRLRAGLGG